MTARPPDAVQAQLREFHENGSRQALAQAFTALRREFVGPVARFLREAPTAPRVEQALSDLLVDLLSVRTGTSPRALAPPHHDNPAAFRRRVLLNALRDRARFDKTYLNAVAAYAAVCDEPAPGAPPQEQLVELRRMRDRVAALLPQLDVRRRAAVALELGIELPLPWIEELASALGLSWGELLGRLRSHEASPYDEERKVRVLYGPQHRIEQAQDAFRQTLNRARGELEMLLQRGRS